jgi:hypothetical protein
MAQFSGSAMKIIGWWSFRRAEGLVPDQLGQRLFDNLGGLRLQLESPFRYHEEVNRIGANPDSAFANRRAGSVPAHIRRPTPDTWNLFF